MTAPFDNPTEIFGPSGVAALYKREIFEKVGLLDQDYFIYSEDIDLNYRAQLAGYRCYYVPGARLYHHLSATTRNMKKFVVHLASRNSITTILKDLPGFLLLKYLPFILAGQIYQLVLFARQKQFFAALLGKLEAFWVLPQTLTKRKIIQKQRKISVRDFEKQWKLGRTTPRILTRLQLRLTGRLTKK
jgi:GT2 family glycosyltransferase